jgi:type IV pilus assembly protein PilY1
MSENVGDPSNYSVCADAVKFVPSGAPTIDIKRAHYYLWSFQTGRPYLVVVDGGAITYYEVKDDGDNVVEPGELRLESDPPADVVTPRDYTAERQNFANWFTYYRRRSLAAIYAISKVITSMSGVRIGIRSADANLIQPVVNIKSGGEDQTSTLLNRLWSLYFVGGTPLRTGLEHVGRCFDKDDGFKLDGTAGNDSPYETVENGGACQQAFVIIVSDGVYTNESLLNASIGNEDGDNGPPYADTSSKTLADIAMYFYERDLATGLDDELATNTMDDATHQHMVTYGVSFGVPGTLDPDDYDEDLKHKTTGAYIAWPDPITPGVGAPERIDDLWHATVNGRGAFFSANNPEELVNSLLLVMMNIESRVASNAAVSVNGDELYESVSNETLMFQSSYSSDGWTGDVKAYQLNTSTGQVITTSYYWSAADELETTTWTGRVIATFDGSVGQPFRFDSPGISDAQKLLLDTDAAEAEKILKYLRGDRSNEVSNGGAYRNRFYKLGDIVESAPCFKNGMVYTAGNDGMLHAFDAQTGEERFAYIPNLVFDNLYHLADPNYAHRFYVNLTPKVEDVSISGVARTLLVGGLGKGGKGYYSLDVKNPGSITTESALAGRVRWEYPDNATVASEWNDLGYSFSEVAIVRSNDASNDWVVIFGNGYNSVNGHAVLVVLKAADGTLLETKYFSSFYGTIRTVKERALKLGVVYWMEIAQ